MAKADAQKAVAPIDSDAIAVTSLLEQIPAADGGTKSATAFQVDDDVLATALNADGTIRGLEDTNVQPKSSATKATDKPKDPVPGDADVEALKQRIAELEKSYSESSTEGKRLHAELKKLGGLPVDTVASVMNTLTTDQNLMGIIQEYMVGKTKPATPKSVAQELGLGEDFYFDPHEAATNPNSPSARYLDKLVEDRASKLVDTKLSQHSQGINEELKRRDQSAAMERAKSAFKSTHPDMTDEKIDELIERAQTHTYTLDDLYLIVHKDEALKKAAASAKSDIEKQRELARAKPASLSTSSTNTGEPASQADVMLSMFSKLARGQSLDMMADLMD